MTRLSVGNLSFEVTQGDLREAFAAYGPVSSRGRRDGHVESHIDGLGLHSDAVAGVRGGGDSGAGWHRPEGTDHERQPGPSGQRLWQPGESATRLGRRRRRTPSLVVNQGFAVLAM